MRLCRQKAASVSSMRSEIGRQRAPSHFSEILLCEPSALADFNDAVELFGQRRLVLVEADEAGRFLDQEFWLRRFGGSLPGWLQPTTIACGRQHRPGQRKAEIVPLLSLSA